MFFKKEQKLEAMIGANSVFKGNISTKGTLRIDGLLEGDAEADSLIVGDKGRIRGDVSARCVMIGGSVEGDINARESIEIRPKGQVTGDIFTARLAVAEGGMLNGRASMQSANGKIVEFSKDKAQGPT